MSTPTTTHAPARPHFVVGHRVPDTDAIASAQALAWMHREINPASNAQAIRTGEPNRQTTWLFRTAGMDLPPLRTSCLARAGEVARPIPIVEADAPLREALDEIRRTNAPFAAVCDDNNTPLGIISDRHPRTNFLLQCNTEDFLGTLLEFRHLVQGLPLEPLNDLPMPEAVDHLEVVMHKHTFAGEMDLSSSVVVIGDRDMLLEVWRKDPPPAVIVAGVARPRAAEIAARLACPVYLFSGSVLNLCVRLPGCLPCSAALETSFTHLPAESDWQLLERAVRTEPLGVLVLDRNQRLVGAVTAADLLNTPTPQLSLVDHSERRQSIEGLDQAEILEIIDHHRLGDIETTYPIAIDVRPLGSTATLLFKRASADGLNIPVDIATLLLGAILSDTLRLTSPTTTEEDRLAAVQLATLGGIDLDSFGLELLRQNDELHTAAPGQLVTRDCKEFAFKDVAFLIAQIETVDLAGLSRQGAEKLRECLLDHVKKAQAEFGIVLVTDVLTTRSELILATTKPNYHHFFRPELNGQAGATPWYIEGMVSRKKQLLPLVFSRLREIHAGQ